MTKERFLGLTGLHWTALSVLIAAVVGLIAFLAWRHPISVQSQPSPAKHDVASTHTDSQGMAQKDFTKSRVPNAPKTVGQRPNDVKPVGTVWTEPKTGMEFVEVPSGCFNMGCGDVTSGCKNDEEPVHEVCLDGFWMSKYKVTEKQWKSVMGNASHGRYRFLDFKGDNYPVRNLTYWHDVREFILNLEKKSASYFRVPTEAEWEYACRSGGKDEKYSGGNNVNDVAWYGGNSFGGTIRPVGLKSPNGLGLYDMSGNVLEWCQDLYDEKAYAKHSYKNPNGGDSGPGHHKVVRGGSYSASPGDVSCTARYHQSIGGDGGKGVGFRLVRRPNPWSSNGL